MGSIGIATRRTMIIPAPPHIYHIDPTGSDGAAGSERAPFRTIGRAARAMAPGDVCRIRSGTYRETVAPPISGKAGSPLRFEAAPGARVVVAGDDPVAGWTPSPDGNWTAPLPAGPVSPTNQAARLYLDGVAVGRSQWPAPGPDVSRPVRATLDRFVSKTRDGERRMTTVVFEDDALAGLRPADVVGGGIMVQPNRDGWSWTLSGRVVALEGRRLTMETRSESGQDFKQEVYAEGSRYSLFPRETFLSPGPAYVVQDGRITIRLPKGATPKGRRITIKRRDLGFDLTDRSFVTLSGLDLHACTVSTDRDAGGDSVGYEADGRERYPWRPVGFVAPSEGVRLENLDVTYPNAIDDVSGHFFFQHGNNTGLVLSGLRHVVKRCRVRFADVNGITLSGSGHRCLENIVEDADLVAVDGAAIYTAPSGLNEDIEIAFNTVRRTGRSAVNLRNWGNSSAKTGRARMHHNDVRDFMLQDRDGGAFYAIGRDGRFARIDHNLFRVDAYRAEGMVFGIYFDFCKNYLADHNVVLGTATPIQVTREFDPEGTRVSDIVLLNNTAIPNGSAWGRPLYADLGRGLVAMNNLLRVNTWRKPDGGTVNHWPRYGDEGTAAGNVVYGDDPSGYYARAESLVKGDNYLPGVDWTSPATLPAVAPSPGVAVPALRRDGLTVPVVAEPGVAPYVGAIPPGGRMFPVGAPPFRRAAAPVRASAVGLGPGQRP